MVTIGDRYERSDGGDAPHLLAGVTGRTGSEAIGAR
jgi:hypothetical protein